jgi:hypothetical protein
MGALPPCLEPPAELASTHAPAGDDDERALARYRHLLRTAAPESIEQAHAVAIARLTAEQRQELLQQVGEMLPPYERALAGPANATPHGIARLITRAEMQQPGVAARLFGGVPAAGAPGKLPLGGVLGASLLGNLVGVVVGSAIGSALLDSGDARLAGADVPDALSDGSSALPGDDGDFDLGGLFDV